MTPKNAAKSLISAVGYYEALEHAQSNLGSDSMFWREVIVELLKMKPR